MKVAQNWVVIDVETSGPNPNYHDVLSVALVPFNAELERQSSAQIFVRPEGEICFDDFARSNFERFRNQWEVEAVPPTEACARIESYLAGLYGASSAIPVGHNVGFDQAFLRKLAFRGARSQLSGLSHRAIDTHTLLQLLAMFDAIPAAATTSSGAFEHFDIAVDPLCRHTALGDAIATKLLLSRLLARLQELIGPAA